MVTQNPRELFFQALNALKANDLQRCETLCHGLLKLNDREVNTLRLLGQVEHSKKNLLEAERRFKQAIDIANDYGPAYVDLGKLYVEQKRFAEAELALKKALSIDPGLKAGRNLLEQLLEKMGKEEESTHHAEINQKRKNLKKDVIEASKLFAEDKGKEAEKICLEVLKIDPANIGAKELLINHAMDTNRGRWAEQLAGSLTEQMPENPKWWLKLASALSRQDKLEQSEQAVKRSLEINPEQIEARMLLGSIYSKNNQFEESLEQYNLILDSHPDYVAAISQKATALKTLGRQDEAIAAYRSCMGLDPKYGEAVWSLSNLKTYRFSDEELEHLNQVLKNEKLRLEDIVHFNYALGKAYEHREQWDDAFLCYQAGNKVKRELVKWDADKFSELVDRIIDTFTAEFVASRNNCGVIDRSPIFILGLPRSGSTLQEQILSSHSQVEGTREMPYMPWIAGALARKPDNLASQRYPEGVRELDADKLQEVGRRFLDQAQRHREQNLPFFIDKLPNNFIYIGLILLSMPNAKIINTRRHPVDNCFSCFKQLWAEGQYFSYDLEDLGRYYVDYFRLMAHWHKVFPGKIYDVQYEEVVQDLEKNVRDLLNFCGLQFEENCLSFHKTKRAVNTASSEQVRQPIYTSAVAYWKHFDKYLGPLKSALGELAAE